MIENLKKIIDKYKDSVDFIEAINIKSNNTPISVKANEINSIESNFSDGIGIRVIKDGKTGFSFSNSIEKIDSVVKSALSSSVFGDKIDFSYPEESKLLQMHDKLDIFSSETADVSVDIMRSELEGLITDISEIDTLNIDADVSKTVSDVSIINSLDRSGSYKKSSYSLSAYGVKVDENGLLWVGSYSSAINRNNIKKDYILSEFRNQLDKSDVFVNPNSSQKMAVVFSPSAYGFLLETFSMGVNGKNHYKKTSPLYNRIGEKVLANNITLFEDPLSNELMGSALFDRELIPTRKKYLFENGIYKSVITDIKTAGQLGVESTGNAVGGYSSLPGVGIRNITLLHGDKPLNTLVNEEDEILFVYSVLGGGQSNMLAGDFSVNVALGYYIKGGERLGRVKNVMLSGNVYDIFMDAELSKEHIINGAKDLPYIKFNNMNVSI